MKKNAWIVILLTLGWLCGCVGMKDSLVSPGRIQRDSIPQGLRHLYEARAQPDLPLEVIGHGAGSYRHYPMSIKKGKYVRTNKNKGCDPDVKSINTLMDMAFACDSIKSIEIDVQAAPLGHLLNNNETEGLFVVHNKVRWKIVRSLESEAAVYMQDNTIRNSLRHFVDNQYFQTKRLHLEIKAKRGCHSPGVDGQKCEDTGKRVAAEIEQFLKEVNQSPLKTENRWLSIISFSAKSLQQVYAALPVHLRNDVDYTLIAGVYPGMSWLGIKWLLGQGKGPVPVFNKKLQQFSAETPWLSSVWFSMQGITKFEMVFDQLANLRAESCRGCKPLAWSVATYPVKMQKLVNKFENTNATFRAGLKSMMIDIDDLCEQKEYN